MPNVIEWANWQSAQANVSVANKAVSGMTPAEAQAALKFGQTGLQNGSNLQIVNSQSVPSTGQVIQFPNASASQAVGEYAASGGQITAGGAAATGGNVSKVTNMAMTQKASGLAGVGALLSVNLPTAAAAIAPVAGVALGAGLYSLNPGLWEKISRALLPFCYDDTELLPVVADEKGTTYFPKDAIDAVKDAVTDIAGTVGDIPNMGAGVELPEADAIADALIPYPFTFAISNMLEVHGTIGPQGGTKYTANISYVIEPGPVHVFCAIDNRSSYSEKGDYYYRNCIVVFASETLFSYASKRYDGTIGGYRDAAKQVVGGKTFYTVSIGDEIRGELSYSSIPIQYRRAEGAGGVGDYAITIGYTMLYGAVEKFPEGVSKWTGVPYPLNPEGIGVVTRITPDGVAQTNPYYPITMPIGDPGVSPKPDEVPNPGENQEVDPAIDPWLTPKPDKESYPDGQPDSNPAQVPNPVPGTDPNLDPNTNPSQVPKPQPDPNPSQSTEHNDGGFSPNPQIPIIPIPPSAATGLLHVYNPTQSQIDAFGSWLWTTFSGDLIDTISKLFNDPMDAVIGLHELYATPAVSGAANIRAGFLDSGVSSNLVGSRYTTINCGSIVVQEYYQNYLDYSPYTKCYIYLPFVGIVPVLADDIIGNAVNVTYHVDSYTGCCIAVVTVAREGYSSAVYQFEGNCAVEIPITSGYQSTLMGALIGVGAAALTGNPHAGIAAANMGRASLGKNDVSHSGSFGSSYGAMGAKVPYIIVKRPTQKSVVNYNQDYGFPAHKRVTVGACSGYLRAREVHVISPTATDEEKAKIEELLKSGIFVK